MKRKTSAIIIVGLMMLALFVITVDAEDRSTVPKENATEDATFDGFGTIMGYIKRDTGTFGVNDADVTGESASFGTYSTKTNRQGYYVLDGLQLSKRRFAYYNVTVNKNGYEVTKEGVYVTEGIVWLNFTLPSGDDSYSEVEKSPVSEISPTDINNDADSANNNLIDEGQETGEIVENETPMDSSTSQGSESSSTQSASSLLSLITRFFQQLFLFLGR